MPRVPTLATSGVFTIVTAILVSALTGQAQQPAGRAQETPYRAPRAADGHADLNGIWQAMNTANWDLQDHPARRGPIIALGASFSIPAGAGVVEGNEIPYQPWAAEKKKQNAESWLTLDPEIKCYMPGVPRATYEPHPFQIVQSGDTLVVDVTGLNDQTWFDRAGNFHSDALHVIERYTRSGPDHLSYEATIEDPKVFTRPWKISMPL